MPADPLTAREQRRYMRQIMLPEIGEEGQLKLKHSRMLVIGVGLVAVILMARSEHATDLT